ncbi:MAG TPA: protein kinase [Rhizomicrobium sp.]|jgi:serine/threonine protein phosphatase PrpC|nr:protein kinase [Rhizomicrobium sp.]
MMSEDGVRASVGFFSDAGPRPDNQDFAAALFGWELQPPRHDVIAVLADGIGGAKGGRIAAETTVRGFLDGFCDLSESVPVQRAAAGVAATLNRWIHAQSQRDTLLAGMGCTLTVLILRGHTAHILHAGDSRLYRLRGGSLACLTSDHVRHSEDTTRLTRALGVEADLRLDYMSQPAALHDRYLLTSDGIHGALAPETMASILRGRAAPQDTARAIVAAALERGSDDNCTALVLDVVQLPTLTTAGIAATIAHLPLVAPPIVGQEVDGFALKALVSEGRYSRLFAASDLVEGGDVVVKFPKPQTAPDETHRQAFLREQWAGSMVQNPWVGRVIELAPGRQSCLYTVMPLYEGELLETRLGRRPQLELEQARAIGVKLARGAAALHRAGVIHRDIKPDNVILESGGSLKLIDLGTARVAAIDDAMSRDIPGTRAYMAPEMGEGEAGNPATDIYALGVTLFRALSGEFPYANLDAVSPSKRDRPQELCSLRPDLPAWLDAALARAIARHPQDRFGDMDAFARELEAGPPRHGPVARRQRTFYERSPVLFWQIVAALLAFGLVLSFLRR